MVEKTLLKQLEGATKAGFVTRYLAVIVDSLILLLPTAFYFSLNNLSNSGMRDLLVIAGWYLVILVLSYILVVLYQALTTTYLGGTLGKLIAGVRVVDSKENNLTLGRALFRYTIGYMVSGLLFGAGFFWIIIDENKQGWHDQLTGSYVIKEKKLGILTALFTIIILLFLNAYLLAGNVNKLINNQKLKEEIVSIQKLFQGFEPVLPFENQETSFPQI